MTKTPDELCLLLSERTELQRMLDRITPDNVITRGSLQARLEVVESKISEAAPLLKLSENCG